MPIPFLAVEISGLADPTYASGGANKNYVDTISGNLRSAIGGGGVSNWADLTAGTGIEAFAGNITVSGTAATSIDVAGYSTISSNAKYGYDELVASGGKWYQAIQVPLDWRWDALVSSRC